MGHQGHNECGGRRKQRRARCQTVNTVDQVERVRDRQNPEDGQGKIDKPRYLPISKQRLKVKEPEIACE